MFYEELTKVIKEFYPEAKALILEGYANQPILTGFTKVLDEGQYDTHPEFGLTEKFTLQVLTLKEQDPYKAGKEATEERLSYMMEFIKQIVLNN